MPELEHRLTIIEETLTEHQHRLSRIEKRQDSFNELVIQMQVLSDRVERVEGEIKEMKADIKSLINKPAKRWDSTITAIITALVAGVVGFILAKFGL